MKVATRQELIHMPAGTLYHEWRPAYFGDLCIKGESIEHPGKGLQDWWSQLVPQVDHETPMEGLADLDQGKAVALTFDCEGRDALFDDEIRYAVWSRDDVEAFRDRLTKALEDSAE